MSKYVKDLISESLRESLKEVDDALLVDMIGLDANTNNRLRAELREKDIRVMVVKNSLARRATEGTPLSVMFEGLTGTSAICWGSEDIVSLAKEVMRLAKDESMAPFHARGGLTEGEMLSAEQVREISKWPSREEQLSLLVGQTLGPGSRLAAQLTGPAGALAGQIAQKGEEEETGDP
jgi:large subunit ribosomal protein L10